MVRIVQDWDFTPPNKPCECKREECSCTDSADFVTSTGIAICGCCFGDCPDVHPEASAKLMHRIAVAFEVEERGLAMVDEGGQVLDSDEDRVLRL